MKLTNREKELIGSFAILLVAIVLGIVLAIDKLLFLIAVCIIAICIVLFTETVARKMRNHLQFRGS